MNGRVNQPLSPSWPNDMLLYSVLMASFLCGGINLSTLLCKSNQLANFLLYRLYDMISRLQLRSDVLIFAYIHVI